MVHRLSTYLFLNRAGVKETVRTQTILASHKFFRSQQSSVHEFRELQLLFQEVQDLEHAILYLAHAHHRLVSWTKDLLK